jgi:hypothetical protein
MRSCDSVDHEGLAPEGYKPFYAIDLRPEFLDYALKTVLLERALGEIGEKFMLGWMEMFWRLDFLVMGEVKEQRYVHLAISSGI